MLIKSFVGAIIYCMGMLVFVTLLNIIVADPEAPIFPSNPIFPWALSIKLCLAFVPLHTLVNYLVRRKESAKS